MPSSPATCAATRRSSAQPSTPEFAQLLLDRHSEPAGTPGWPVVTRASLTSTAKSPVSFPLKSLSAELPVPALPSPVFPLQKASGVGSEPELHALFRRPDVHFPCARSQWPAWLFPNPSCQKTAVTFVGLLFGSKATATGGGLKYATSAH